MEFSLDPKICQLRQEMHIAIEKAKNAAHAFYAECEVGDERTWGGNIHQILHQATRRAREDL